MKNIPLVYCEDIPDDEGWQRCNQKDMEKLSDWIEGFERELRELLENSSFEDPMIRIREVLGE